jgi:hypothetical protein
MDIIDVIAILTGYSFVREQTGSNGLRDFEELYDLLERYWLFGKMGLCFVVDGKFNEAVKIHTAVVQWRENKLGTSELQTLEAYTNLGKH